jgi:hypothetical protein
VIAAELKSVYEIEELALSTAKKWRKRFAEGRTALTTTKSVKDRFPTTSPGPLLLCWRRGHTFHGRFSAGTSAFQRRCACGFFMIRSAWKVPSSLGSPCPGHESERRKSHFITWNSFGVTERSLYSFPECHHWEWIMALLVLSPWFYMGVGTRRSARKSHSKDWHRKGSNFLLWSVDGIYSLVDVPKGAHIIQHAFAILSYQIYMTNYVTLPKKIAQNAIYPPGQYTSA